MLLRLLCRRWQNVPMVSESSQICHVRLGVRFQGFDPGFDLAYSRPTTVGVTYIVCAQLAARMSLRCKNLCRNPGVALRIKVCGAAGVLELMQTQADAEAEAAWRVSCCKVSLLWDMCSFGSPFCMSLVRISHVMRS